MIKRIKLDTDIRDTPTVSLYSIPGFENFIVTGKQLINLYGNNKHFFWKTYGRWDWSFCSNGYRHYAWSFEYNSLRILVWTGRKGTSYELVGPLSVMDMKDITRLLEFLDRSIESYKANTEGPREHENTD